MTARTDTKIGDDDRDILRRRMALFDKRTGPRVGDWIYMLGEDEPRRFSHDWDDDGLQTTCMPGDSGSFYLGEISPWLRGDDPPSAYMSYSGALDPIIPLDKIEATTETREGRCWFFKGDMARANNGYEAIATFRVYRQKP